MTKLKSIKCDRCGDIFTIPITENPAQINMRFSGDSNPRRDGERDTPEIDLCVNCESCYGLFMTGQVQVDKLLEKVEIDV